MTQRFNAVLKGFGHLTTPGRMTAALTLATTIAPVARGDGFAHACASIGPLQILFLDLAPADGAEPHLSFAAAAASHGVVKSLPSPTENRAVWRAAGVAAAFLALASFWPAASAATSTTTAQATMTSLSVRLADLAPQDAYEPTFSWPEHREVPVGGIDQRFDWGYTRGSRSTGVWPQDSPWSPRGASLSDQGWVSHVRLWGDGTPESSTIFLAQAATLTSDEPPGFLGAQTELFSQMYDNMQWQALTIGPQTGVTVVADVDVRALAAGGGTRVIGEERRLLPSHANASVNLWLQDMNHNTLDYSWQGVQVSSTLDEATQTWSQDSDSWAGRLSVTVLNPSDNWLVTHLRFRVSTYLTASTNVLPVAEPNMLALMSAGLAGIGCLQQLRRRARGRA